jgi:hypothetical protein
MERQGTKKEKRNIIKENAYIFKMTQRLFA